MTNQHPITPPPDLLDRWHTLPCHLSTKEIFVMVARWGADQELEACVNWLIENQNPRWALALEAARRPKPPTDKELALRELGDAYDKGKIDDTTYDAIRKALEQLND